MGRDGQAPLARPNSHARTGTGKFQIRTKRVSNRQGAPFFVGFNTKMFPLVLGIQLIGHWLQSVMFSFERHLRGNSLTSGYRLYLISNTSDGGVTAARLHLGVLKTHISLNVGGEGEEVGNVRTANKRTAPPGGYTNMSEGEIIFYFAVCFPSAPSRGKP